MDAVADWGLFAVLFCVCSAMLVRYYQSVWKPYEGFPTSNYFYHLLRTILFGGLPENVPATTFVLQYNNGLSKLYEKEGFCHCWMMYNILFVSSPEVTKCFLTDPAAMEKGKIYEMMRFALGNGLITSKCKTWAQHRKIINPTFHRTQYKNFAAVFNRKSIELVQDLKSEKNTPMDLSTVMARHLFNAMLETVIGIEDDNFTADGISIEDYFEATREIVDFVSNRGLRPWLFIEFLWPLLPAGLRVKQKAEMSRKFPKQVIKEMLKSTVEIEKQNRDEYDFVSAKCKPLVRLFLEAHRRDPKAFTLQDVEDELMTIMAAGFHTVAAAILWAIYLLGLHEDVQERAFDEVCSKMSDGLTYEDLQELPYLESVIKETMRLYPAVPLVARSLDRDVQLGSRTVPKDTQIVINIYMLHRDPEVFPNPEVFDPSRFDPDKKDQIGRFSYLPFAEGPRACIGKRYAVVELQIFLAHLIRNFKIVSLDQRDKVILKNSIVLCPVEMPRIKLIPRES